MKRPARGYRFALLFALLALCGFSIYAHKALENRRGARADHLQPTRPAAAKPARAINNQSTTSANEEGAAATEAGAPAQTSRIAKSVVAGGGGESAGGTLNVKGTIGQPVVGTSVGGTFTLRSGFWTTPAAAAANCSGVTITIKPETLPPGRVGVPYNQPLTVMGGTAPYTFSLAAGALPTGVPIVNGVLTGTPAQAANFGFTLRATDANGCFGDKTYVVPITSCPTIGIAPATLPPATVGQPYNQPLTASGGTAPYVFNLASGALPPDLQVISGGAIVNTPTVRGDFSFGVKVRDANGCESTQPFMLRVNPPPTTARIVRIVPSSGGRGGPVSVPIEIAAQGGENTVSFTLNYDAAVLGNPRFALGTGALAGSTITTNPLNSQTATGRVGVILQAPVGQALAAGTRQLLVVTFDIAAATTATSTALEFGNQTITQRVVSADAMVLEATFTGGVVTIASGIEADVLPQPNGDGDVFSEDVVRIARLALQLNTPQSPGEFQRADCGPRSTKGDGFIDSVDVVQAARYALGIDPLVSAGGPTEQSLLAEQASLAGALASMALEPRIVRIVNTNGAPGAAVNVPVEIVAQGGENTVSFTLNYDAAVLGSPRLALGTGALTGSTITTNPLASQTATGRIGVILQAPVGQSLAAGTRQLMVITFNIAATTTATSTALEFGDQTIRRRVVSDDASVLEATFTGGAVTINQPNPAPTLSALSPNAATAGGAGFTLTVAGTGFINSSVVRWNGSDRATTFVSATQLTAQISAADIATAGTASVTVFNPAPGGGLSPALAFTIRLPREVRLVAAMAVSGGMVVVPIELIAQGDENAVGLSIAFDPAVLANPQPALGGDTAGAQSNFNTSQVAAGRLGLLVSLASGQTFSAGTRRIFNITFTVAGGAGAGSTAINFGDQPVARQIVNPTATPLPAIYTAGAVTITPSLEADVQPRPGGDGVVTAMDWMQVGRFAAGLDTAANGGEFQRTDCAPKETRGDGLILVSDWVQAGRYAAGLDAVVQAGGPTSPTAPGGLLPTVSGEPAASDEQSANDAAQSRAVRALVASGTPSTITLTLNALGGENALGLSLLFNPSQWRFVSAANGSATPDAALNVNTSQASRGRLGLALALPTGRVLAAGAQQLAVLTFEALGGGAPALALSFGDAPVSREVVAVDARPLAASFAVELGGSPLSLLASVSAASFRDGELAREQIVAAFGSNLAVAVAVADTLPLPTELAGVRVVVTDSAGAARNAPLFFVSPTQINYQFPAGTADGAATVTVVRGGETYSIGIVSAGPVAPGLFTADASGTGLPAATALRVNAAGMLSYEPISRFDPATSRIVAVPINLGAPEDQVFLVLFGTGVRGRSNLANVAGTVGGVAAEVNYAGEAEGFAGLDQINVRLPRALAGRGDVNVVLRVDGRAANTVRINVR